MTLVGNTLYVADTDALLAFPYQMGQTKITDPGRKVCDLPSGKINHHWTKNVIASKDGSKLFVTIGSNSNAGENGLDVERDRADIWEIDPRTGSHRVFASGLRNPNGLDWAPGGALWTTVNERDELGGDLVPDYMTSVSDGGFYGSPYSYYGQHVDERVKPQDPKSCQGNCARLRARRTYRCAWACFCKRSQTWAPICKWRLCRVARVLEFESR